GVQVAVKRSYFFSFHVQAQFTGNCSLPFVGRFPLIIPQNSRICKKKINFPGETALSPALQKQKSRGKVSFAPAWRRGCDSNAQCLAAHHISNVAPYQLEYLSVSLTALILYRILPEKSTPFCDFFARKNFLLKIGKFRKTMFESPARI